MTDEHDQRREPRFAVSHLVPAIWEGRATAIDCPVSDISRNGAFLEMEDPPRLQTQICIGPAGSEARGRVVFTLPLAQADAMGRRPGVGIHLDTIIDPDTFLLACSEAQAAARAAALEQIGFAELGADDLDLELAAFDDVGFGGGGVDVASFDAIGLEPPAEPIASPGPQHDDVDAPVALPGRAVAPEPIAAPPLARHLDDAVPLPARAPEAVPSPPPAVHERPAPLAEVAVPLPGGRSIEVDSADVVAAPAPQRSQAPAIDAVPLPGSRSVDIDFDADDVVAAPAPQRSAAPPIDAVPLPGSRSVEIDFDAADDVAAPAPQRSPASAIDAVPLPGSRSVEVDFDADDAPPAPAPPPVRAPHAPAPSIPLPGVRPAVVVANALPSAVGRARKREVIAARDAAPAPAENAAADFVAEPFVAEVVLVEGVAGQAVLAQALALDDYTALVARHGLEGLVLCLRRRPLLCVVSADADRLPGRLLVEDIRRRPELRDVKVVLVDGSAAPDPPGCVRWKGVPNDLGKARRLIDDALGAGGARATTKGPEDARDLASAIAQLASRLGTAGEYDVGIAALRYATELAPTVSGHTLALGRALLQSSDAKLRAEAAVLVERVVRQDPRAPEGHLLRAVVFDQRGKKDDARIALKRCLALAPGDLDAVDALDKLQAGVALLEVRDADGGAELEGTTPEKKQSWLARLFGR